MQKIEDLTCKAQQRQRQGRTLEAIRLFEQALEHRIDLHGPDSSSVRKACDSLSDVLNGAALKHLQSEEYEEAKKLLQKAEMLTGPDDLISAVTYNNIACYYRRMNKLRTALKYLEKAQRIEMKSRVVANPAGTRLNLCAVLSQLERHGEALEHAQAAVVLLQEELAQLELNDDYEENSPETLNKMAVLAISYHNIGVEEEYLKRYAGSLAAYERGVQIARQYLGRDNDITRTLIKSCQAAQEHLDAARMKKGFSPPGIIRQGESMGGAYDALQQHQTVKRRAQSAGAQRSESATPSWAEGDISSLRPSTAHPGASGSRSLSRTRAWVDESRKGNVSLLSSGSDKGPLRSDIRDRSRHPQDDGSDKGPLRSDIRDRSRHPQDRNGVVEESKASEVGSRGMNGRQRPASALGSVAHAMGSRNGIRELEPLGGSLGVKRGPKTPRELENGDQKVPAIRRPPSASMRQPVRTHLGNGIEREALATQLNRVAEEKEKKQEDKMYAWEELNGLDIDDDDFLDDSIHDQGPPARRVSYERAAGQAGRGTSRPRALASRDGDRDAGFAGDGDRDVGFGGLDRFKSVDPNNSNRGGIHEQMGALEDDDLLDDYEDGEVDVDSGTEEIIQDRRMSGGAARDVNRPTSASQSRPLKDVQSIASAARSSVRPASASVAVIQERRQLAARPASAAPSRSVPDSNNDFHQSHQRSYGSAGADRTWDFPVSDNVDRRSSRPATASLARPASASQARPGSLLATPSHYARPASASISRPGAKDLRHDEIARSNHREEREILDILSDHSEYESDLELEAEVMAMNTGSREPNQRNALKNDSMSAKPPRNKQTLNPKPESMVIHRERQRDAQPPVRSGDQDLQSKRAQLLAKTEIGLDHSEYESDDAADTRGASLDPRDARTQVPPWEASRGKYPALEQINARIVDRQYEDRQVVGGAMKRPQRPSDGGRPQRPSDRSRAPNRSSRPSDTNTGRQDHREAVTLWDHGEYESNDDMQRDTDRPHLEDMSGTLKWLEDGLTTRND